MTRPIRTRLNGRRLVLVTGDVAVFCVAFGLALRLRGPSSFTASSLVPFIPTLGCLLLTTYAAGLYELRVIRNFVSLVGGLIASTAVCSLFAISYFYLFADYISFAPKATLNGS